MNIKAVIMAGGKGTRLRPLTSIISKHLFPIYDKPMIFYTLSLLELSKVSSVLIIVNPTDKSQFEKIVKHYKGKIKIFFEIQRKPNGIAECFNISKNFLRNSKKFILILGDNFFFGREINKLIFEKVIKKNNKSWVFLSPVDKPEKYGIAYFKKKNKLEKIIEKPKNKKSNFAVTGLYVYDQKVFKLLKKIKKSKRGELEISSVNNKILKNNLLDYCMLGRGTTWFDMGTFDDIFNTSEFVKLIQKRQGELVGVPKSNEINK